MYSKYITAAMEASAKHAAIGAAHNVPQIPPMFERSPISDFVPDHSTHVEICNDVRERLYAIDLQAQAQITGTALWAAQRKAGIRDATDAALQRLDANEECQARYRAAQGYPAQRPRKPEPKIKLQRWVSKSLVQRLEVLAALRGETHTDTMAWVLECGLALLDERTKRYEAYVFANMSRLLGAADRARAELNRTEPQRFLAPQSPTLERSYHMAYPYSGGPPALVAVAREYPAA